MVNFDPTLMLKTIFELLTDKKLSLPELVKFLPGEIVYVKFVLKREIALPLPLDVKVTSERLTIQFWEKMAPPPFKAQLLTNEAFEMTIFALLIAYIAPPFLFAILCKKETLFALISPPDNQIAPP